MSTVTVDVGYNDGQLSIQGYEPYLSKTQVDTIVADFFEKYPIYYSPYLQERLNKIVSDIKKANSESWNYFPSQRSSFSGANPLALMRLRNRTLRGEVHPTTAMRLLARYDPDSGRKDFIEQHVSRHGNTDPGFVRGHLSHLISNARHQVFPVAARKTRHRKNRKSRKSRR